MYKIKNILLLLTLACVFVYSCDDTPTINNPFLDIDHEELALADNDTLVKFLKNYYYDEDKDSLQELVSGKTALFDDVDRLIEIPARRNDIDYTLYVYKIREGNPAPDVDKGFPTVADSVFVKYYGQTIITANEVTDPFDSNVNGNWFSYASLAVRGWSYGFTVLKGGALKTEADGSPFNGPVTFLNTGKAIFFIPSGLAYTSINPNNYSSSLVNANLIFNVELLDFVKDTDQDGDGIPSIEEDANGDGDLTNDFNDNLNPTIPDYLNPNV